MKRLLIARVTVACWQCDWRWASIRAHWVLLRWSPSEMKTFRIHRAPLASRLAQVALMKWPTALEAVAAVQPSVLFCSVPSGKGPAYSGPLHWGLL